MSSKQGDHEMVVENAFANGGCLGLYMEQRVHNDKVLVLALRTHMSTSLHGLACLFDIQSLLQYPEFYVGLIYEFFSS